LHFRDMGSGHGVSFLVPLGHAGHGVSFLVPLLNWDNVPDPMSLTPCPSVYMFFQFFYTYLPFRNKYGIIAARKRIHAHIHSFKRVMYMCKEEDKVMILDPANKKQI